TRPATRDRRRRSWRRARGDDFTPIPPSPCPSRGRGRPHPSSPRSATALQMTELFRTSGAGNDFLALVEPAAPPAPEIIRAWCARGVSLGADGVFTTRRAGEHGDAGAVRAIDLVYWNADGGEAALCVNATRCAAQLA